MTFELWSVYVLAYFIVALVPGPAVLFVTSQSAWRGRSAGLTAALGIETANSAYWALTALGLASAIAASQAFFLIIKWVGVAYLAWLGIQAIRSSIGHVTPSDGAARAAKNAYRDGIIVGLSNPKGMLFFLALVPQFVVPDKAAMPQIVVMALTGVLVSFSVNAGYAIAAGTLRGIFARGNVQKWFNRGVGGLFLSLAAAAAFYRRTA